MYRNRRTKIVCWAISIASIIAYILRVMAHMEYALYSNCTILERLIYPISHANWLHLGVNLYMFNLCFYKCNMSLRQMACAFLVAWIAPATSIHVVGLSSVCYALFGILFAHIKGKRSMYLTQVLITIIVGMLVPRFSWQIHSFCFLVGLAIGFPLKKILQQ